jgi:hypothetical protein
MDRSAYVGVNNESNAAVLNLRERWFWHHGQTRLRGYGYRYRCLRCADSNCGGASGDSRSNAAGDGACNVIVIAIQTSAVVSI